MDDVHKTILGYLRTDCSNTNSWGSCIYGTEGYFEDFDDSNFIVDIKLISRNYCGESTKLTRSLCEGCERNFRKISQYLDKLDELAINWDSPFDESLPNSHQIKEVMTYDEWKEIHGDTIDESWKIKEFDCYFDKDITPYLEELSQYDVIDFGWYFNQDLFPLTTLSNLKGIVLGHWFNKDLDCLKDCPQLLFVQVRYSYNKRIHPVVYDKVFRANGRFRDNK